MTRVVVAPTPPQLRGKGGLGLPEEGSPRPDGNEQEDDRWGPLLGKLSGPGGVRFKDYEA